ncbi:phosphogluconate dehydrogenase (NADP(+)-dependent, decarboxylating) [Psittacicella hinzii]|uniref:6-phosphogluconate dehydrogenase, decarboxylating n=1 Tax=Psittacicella hinzii TaxID=2028575 RepID=A0A3A1Y7B6_9GAMM|nr:decarboxylating NADP(+)-dependent phosphogluconate dehydrogenase [Psittacicella hinzii]RIY33505.1 phosphogluconate dehydrogenase (NADP(+)-dependent, decarboxylating) [Psittacicella hinzii]
MSLNYDIGVVGLAVMGQNLILNMNDHGFKVVAYNRSQDKVIDFINGPAKDTNIVGATSLEDMVSKLASPRKVFLMVRAGEVVDVFIEQLLPLLEKGDIIIDGGNSNYVDTNRRTKYLEEKGILYVGTGVSGGEEGARRGPSIMPGGNPLAWESVKPILQAISAKTPDGYPCCDWVGKEGAGHFVKMVHNGIEYGDMQLICEAYHFLSEYVDVSYDQLADIFTSWNKTELDSYLVEITADILRFKDEDGSALVSKILDTAGQKGTGKWTGINALDFGVPLTLITESVFMRCVSALKDQRLEAEKVFGNIHPPVERKLKFEEAADLIEHVRKALLASKIISYAQGFMLMKTASDEFNWDINLGNTALLWREGCIIRSKFLQDIKNAFDKNPDLNFLGLDEYFRNILIDCLPSWRKICSLSIEHGIPVPCMAAGLQFLDSYTLGKLPANLLQAQRDYFGAHTYQRVDRPLGEVFHTNWTGTGGDVSATKYDV